MTGERPLFAVVRADAANHGALAGPAAAQTGVCQPVCPAAVGAEDAIGQPLPGVNGPFLQHPAAMQGQVRGFEDGHKSTAPLCFTRNIRLAICLK